VTQRNTTDPSEQALLLNIVIASQKAAVARKKAAKTWVAISIAAITSLEQHPFATWGNVVKRLRRESPVGPRAEMQSRRNV
jgi:hypothetical protein